jgi:transcriptional regulator with XRE-family HTH domain
MANKVGIKQQALSRLENPYYGKATLSTLKKIAAGCDVGLLVEFVPFSRLVNRVSGTPYIETGFSTETMNLPPFEEEENNGTFNDEQKEIVSNEEKEERSLLGQGSKNGGGLDSYPQNVESGGLSALPKPPQRSGMESAREASA